MLSTAANNKKLIKFWAFLLAAANVINRKMFRYRSDNHQHAHSPNISWPDDNLAAMCRLPHSQNYKNKIIINPFAWVM